MTTRNNIAKIAVRTLIRLGILLCFLVTTQALFGVTYTAVVYDTDGTGTQSKRPIELMVVFKDGEISSGSCARPVVGGVAVTTGQWQYDGKTYYASGSPETGIVTYQGTITSGGSNTITFQNGTCANTPLSAAAMAGFDAGQGAGNWDAQFSFTPKGGSAYTQNVKAMLTDNDPNSNTFGDCKNNFWQAGPVVTTVIVQDCTSASKWDFGWHWTGGVMIGGDGNPHTAPYTANSQFASIHPYAIVHFYPVVNSSTATIFIEAVWENSWSGRGQDQNFDAMAFKAFGSGASLSTVYSRSPNFTMVWGTNYRKVGWSGPALGNIRPDIDFAHLRETHAIPYFDLTSQVIGKVTTTSDSPGSTGESGCATPYSPNWTGGDKGDFGGIDAGLYAIDQDYSSNCEGAPSQREPLLYLYNMNAAYSHGGGTAGTANGEAAKAWLMLFGTKGAADSTLVAAIAGGAGVAGNAGNIPYHSRESRTAGNGSQTTTNLFYVPAFDDKNVAGDFTCSSTGTCDPGSVRPANDDATGRFGSRHAHSDISYGPAVVPWPATAVGDITSGGWLLSGCNHWQDWVYEPYLMTGSYYLLQEVFAQASYCGASIAPDNAAYFDSHGFYAYSNPQGGVLRELAWGIYTEARAAFVAPDSSPEKALYSSYVKSNLGVQEGVQNLTGTTLTPTTRHPNCDAGTVLSWNRWDFGHCAVMSLCASTTMQAGVSVASCTPKNPVRHESVPGGAPAGTYTVGGDNSNMIFLNTINVQTSCGFIIGVAHVTAGAIDSIAISPGGNGGGNCGAGPVTCAIQANSGSGATCTVTLSGGSATAINVTAGGSGYLQPQSRSYQEQWMESFLSITLAQTRLLGFTQAQYVQEDTQKQQMEYILDSTANGYLVANYLEPLASLTNSATTAASIGQSADPMFANFTAYMAALPACVAALNTFDPFYQVSASCPAVGIQCCSGHSYVVAARAAISTAPYFGTSAADANCPSGTCTAAAAWSWISSNTRTPYFFNAAMQAMNASTKCANSDYQIKFALDSESGTPPPTVTACLSISPASPTIAVPNTQAYTGICHYSDGSDADCTSSLVLSSGTPSVATVSGQIATAVAPGTSTVSATDNGHACGNTSALTVTNPVVNSGSALRGILTGTGNLHIHN